MTNQNKPTPHLYSAEAEAAVIGGLILDNSLFDEVIGKINSADFHFCIHQVLFKGIADLIEAGQPADILTLDEYLKQKNLLKEIGGFAYLAEVSKNTPSTANVGAYADVVLTDMLIEWRNHIVGDKIKAVTWNNYVRHLKALYNFGISRESKGRKKTYSIDQLHKIEHILNDNIILPDFLKPSWFVLAIIMTLKCTGIRRGQLVKLKISDVSLTNRTIYISPEINKNHDYHIVPISNSLYPHMEKLITELKIRKQTDNCQLFNLNVFSRYTRRRGQPMSQNQLTHIFRHISDLVGFTSSPHRFRHTVVTQLMKKPENVYVVQKLLGHRDISVTLGYIEHDVEMLRETVNLL